MRIVHAVRSDGFAGVERHVARLAQAQAAHGHDVVVVGGDPDRMRAALGESRVLVLPAATVLDVIARVRHAARGADVVHAHMTAAEIGATVAAWSGGTSTLTVPLVTTRHFARARGTGGLRGLTAAVARSRVRAQIAISTYVADRVDGSSVVVHAGVDVRPDAVPAVERRRTVLVVQRLEQEKATDIALRAFASSGLGGTGWTLEVAGDGAQRRALETLADALGVARSVRFLGASDDVVTLMSRSALLLAPCPVEGLGLSVLEAMACGLPVVASAAGGHLETVGVRGQDAMFPPGDFATAGAVLGALAADEHRRDALARAGQDRQRTAFTLDAQVRQTDEIYRGVQ
ncbi:glycosyltransferase family 4 protein [Pengzhenrongella frigida]|uniref:Glycosyltransferase n=1 Tax=Pengzhenrongella frigida TaxID=1259133 RepID=A0A4Q5MYJ2_9MICO|nr:glycosyltransferase family 4 protein [Cellulomonas sp. HLT2-17]RYV50765.1 glycosyltransferase [Cellulomonas sp. HLT2-17]